ncbi:MAG: hypothetical protein D4R65_02750 [Verrucomicrobiaceae bacterium]|nr:MAG: hypothetical protein D4R65_02750 [Verrucomicrobiaceae bacterium]
MAGHNKWSKVKRLKGALDAKRGRLFSRLSKEIAVAARLGGGTPAFNPRLRAAVQVTRTQSMPGDNVLDMHANFEIPEDILVRLN